MYIFYKIVLVTFLIESLISISAYAYGTGAATDSPFLITYSFDNGLLHISVKESNLCLKFPPEKCEFIAIEYLEVSNEHSARGYFQSSQWIQREFLEHPDNVRRINKRDAHIFCGNNVKVIALPVFAYNGNTYIGKSKTINIKSQPEIYECEGCEIAVETIDDTTLFVEVDATTSSENADMSIEFYNINNELVCVERIDALNEAVVGSGRYRLQGKKELKIEDPVEYATVIINGEQLCSAGVLPLETSSEEVGNSTVFTVQNEAVTDVRAYGPIPAYSEKKESYRYYRSFENSELVKNNLVEITVPGYYMITGMAMDGVEYKKIIYVQEYYEKDGLEITVMCPSKPCVSSNGDIVWENEIYFDATTAEQSPTIYACLYNSENKLIRVISWNDFNDSTIISTMVDNEGRFWLKKTSSPSPRIVYYTHEAVSYARAFMWDDGLKPLISPVTVAGKDLEVLVEPVENGTAVTVAQDGISHIKVYGPGRSYIAQDNVRYLRSVENHSYGYDKNVLLQDPGPYMIVATDENGVEYKAFVTVQ